MDIEKRAVVRWDVSLPVQYCGLNSPTEGACATKDLSTMGARLAMVEKHRVGDILEMRLQMPGVDQGGLCLEAEVVWQRRSEDFQESCNYMTGVTFRKILECHRTGIASYVSASYPDEFRKHWWDGI